MWIGFCMLNCIVILRDSLCSFLFSFEINFWNILNNKSAKLDVFKILSVETRKITPWLFFFPEYSNSISAIVTFSNVSYVKATLNTFNIVPNPPTVPQVPIIHQHLGEKLVLYESWRELADVPSHVHFMVATRLTFFPPMHAPSWISGKLGTKSNGATGTCKV